MSTAHNRKIQWSRSDQVMYASSTEEFYYVKSDEPVPEGEAIGMDVEILDKPDRKDGRVDLILFEDIYWSPPWGHDCAT
jgi:hypothetical protein